MKIDLDLINLSLVVVVLYLIALSLERCYTNVRPVKSLIISDHAL